MKKIIILNYGLHICGVSRALVNFANAMVEKGYEVEIKIEINDFELADLLRPEVKVSLFLREPKFFGKRIKGFLRFYSLWLKMLKKLPARLQYKLVVPKNNDIEISFNRGLSAKIIAASTNKRAKKFIWVHNDYLKCSNPIAGFETQEEATAAYKKYDKIICVSERSKLSFIEKYGITENVISEDNILNEEQMRNLSLEEVEMEKGVNLVAIGRLSEQKAYDIMLNACKKLNDKGVRYNLYIIGDGELKDELMALKNELKLSNVHFKGADKNPYKYLKNADIYICSSIYEGLSTTVIEALILGKPVIVTDCTGMRDILVDGKYGVITQINADSLFEGTLNLIENSVLREKYAQLSLERGKYYYKENTVNRLLAVLEESNG